MSYRTGFLQHTPDDDRHAASAKPCTCLRWPAEPDATNTEVTLCQLCGRRLACPFDAMYPVYSFRTNRMVERHTCTVSPDWFPADGQMDLF